MTREEAIQKWVIPSIERTWNDKKCKEIIKALEPTGHWIRWHEGHWIRWYEQKDFGLYIEKTPHCKCSECGKEYDSDSSQFIKYCNECGAKMLEPQAESEDKE